MQTQRHIQVTARREDRGPIRIVEVFQPEDMRGTVPSQRFVAALHRAMNLGNAQLHVPHGGDALSDEPRRVVSPLFDEPVVVMSVIVDFLRENPPVHGVLVVHPGAGFLLPGGVRVTMQACEGVPAHVPHVGDRG